MTKHKPQPEHIQCTPDKLFIDGVEQDKPTGFLDALQSYSAITDGVREAAAEAEGQGAVDEGKEEKDEFLPASDYDPSKPYGGIDAQRDQEAQGGKQDDCLAHEYAISCRVFIENPHGPLSELGRVQLARLRSQLKRELSSLGDDVSIENTETLMHPGRFKEFTVSVRGTSLEDIMEKLGIECPEPDLRSTLLCRRIMATAAEFHNAIDVVDRARQQADQDYMNRGTWD